MLEKALNDLRGKRETVGLVDKVRTARVTVEAYEALLDDLGFRSSRGKSTPENLIEYLLELKTSLVREETVTFSQLVLTMKTNYYKFHRKF